MHALARPGERRAIQGAGGAPRALGQTLGAIALTLLDFETNVYLGLSGEARDTAARWLAFHTGTRIVETPAEAAFAILSDGIDLPDFGTFGQGTDIYPDRSTTLLIPVAGFDIGQRFRLKGPGIEKEREIAIDGIAPDLAERLTANRELFPRGVDLVLVAPGEVIGLPRTTRVTSLIAGA
jgi:alpha-D-ribose 1-methylphosphonate 5-triphosphate synthase subunit PhnH